MDWLMPVSLAVGVTAVLLGLSALGWRNRQRRQQAIGAPDPAPANLPDPYFEAAGQYVVTTTAGDWLDRVAVHGLGVKSDATAAVSPLGILLARRGAPDVFIPRSSLRGVRLEGGMAGKFVEKDGLVVFAWTLHGLDVDTGFRTRHAPAKAQLLAAATQLATAPDPSADPQPEETP